MSAPLDPKRRLKEFLSPAPWRSDYWERVCILRSMRKIAPHFKDGPALDVGCGIKPYESILARPGQPYWGVDYPATLANAHGMISRADVHADCLRLPFVSNAFETVVCTQVLEHVPEPAVLAREMARVLRPGGILALSAPMAWPLHEEPYDFYRYTVYGFRHLFREAGLDIFLELPRGQGVFALGQLFLTLLAVGAKPHGRIGNIAVKLTSLFVNLSSPLLDRLWPKPGLCLGWTILARKPANPFLRAQPGAG
jgi:SAM-dependent methyltransferase